MVDTLYLVFEDTADQTEANILDVLSDSESIAVPSDAILIYAKSSLDALKQCAAKRLFDIQGESRLVILQVISTADATAAYRVEQNPKPAPFVIVEEDDKYTWPERKSEPKG
jgi:hypothetical protein